MRESSTIQAFFEEGRVKGLAEEARRFIFRMGRTRFGEAGDAVVSRRTRSRTSKSSNSLGNDS